MDDIKLLEEIRAKHLDFIQKFGDDFEKGKYSDEVFKTIARHNYDTLRKLTFNIELLQEVKQNEVLQVQS